MRSRFARLDFAKLARRTRGLRGAFVLALAMTTALAGCVNLSPPWEGAKPDAEAPLGSGGGFILADASAVGGSAGAPGPIEGLLPTGGPVSSSRDATVLEAGTTVALDAQPLYPDVARGDAQEVSPESEAGSLERADSKSRDAESDVSLGGSGGAGGAALDAGSGGTSGEGGTGGHPALDAADRPDRDLGSDSAAGGSGSGGSGSGGNPGTGTGGIGSGGTGTGGAGSGGAATGGSGGGVCASYHGRDAGSGIDEGQIAYYRCESATGASGLEDSSGRRHDATLHTGMGGAAGYSFITGKVHDALHLVAAQQGFVTLPAGLLDDACEATVATWVWIDSSQKWQRVFDFGRDDSVYMFLTPKSGASGKLRFAISLAGLDGEQIIDGSEELPTGAWYHVAVVLGPAGGALYVDGSKVGSNAGLTLRPADLGNLPNMYIGRSQYSKDPYFDGNIDSFRIYDRALSDAEIREAYAYDGT